jgi:ParB-like chromosome segregation protein Spo0J
MGLAGKKVKKVLMYQGEPLSENLLPVSEGPLPPEALAVGEKLGFIKLQKASDGTTYYSQEDLDLVTAMMACLGRCANLTEAYKIAAQGRSLKKKRGRKTDSPQLKTIDPTKVKMRTRFKNLLDIDGDLSESLTADMVVNGYYSSMPIVLATWPSLKKPVLVDGHTRVQAAIKAGIPEVPYMIEKFDNEEGALQHIANVQTKRRPSDDWVLYQLISELDNLKPRGGDRRSEQAKSKGSQDPNETEYSSSAQMTGALVGTSASTVKRARSIAKNGTPEIIEALKNRKMTISQAAKAIVGKPRTKAKKEGELTAAPNEDAKVQLTDENLAGLKDLGGNRHSHVNKAVREYLERELRTREALEHKDSTVDAGEPSALGADDPTFEEEEK